MGHFNKVIHTLKPFYYYRIGRNDVPEATRLNTLLSTVHARRAGFSRDRASWHLVGVQMVILILRPRT